MKRFCFTLLIVMVLAFPSTAYADIAPPYNPPGSNPEPGSETTQVRMAAETVLIDVKNEGNLGRARITADFTMHNLGNTSESMAVRFPISADNGRGEYPEITDTSIKVNGKQISFQRVNYPDIRYYNQDQEVPWAEFDVTFPAGEDIAIQITYSLDGSGYINQGGTDYPPFTAFYYVLQTGAGWKDTIGSADIILRLPYPATTQNVIMGMQIGFAETTPAGVFEGNEVRWHFDDFEPGMDGGVQDMEIALVAPSAWQTVLKERDNVARNPNDSEAWGRLAKSYKEIFLMIKGYRTDTGGEEIYQLSVEAYEKCLVLKPNDAQWHAGFADLLAGRSYFDSWYGPTPDTFRALDEIHTALQLAPNDAKVLEIAQNISYMFPDGISQNGNGYAFPWLTQTPTPVPATPTIVPAYDPAIISGTYQSISITLSNNKAAQLAFTLNPNYSAEMQTQYEGGTPIIYNGSWLDDGDGMLRVSMINEYGRRIEFIFEVDGDGLQAVQYPSIYGYQGESGIELDRIDSATPIPRDAPLQTPGDSGPVPQARNPLCGSAALAPLSIFIWMKRARKKGDMI